jgi:plasmid stability protein
MTDILIRGVPEPVLAALRQRASRHRRSLQQELLGVLETVAQEPERRTAVETAAAIRCRLGTPGRTFEDSTLSIREDRER